MSTLPRLSQTPERKPIMDAIVRLNGRTQQ
jgi:hypothetical protein